jgi:hypothetical protein
VRGIGGAQPVVARARSPACAARAAVNEHGDPVGRRCARRARQAALEEFRAQVEAMGGYSTVETGLELPFES